MSVTDFGDYSVKNIKSFQGMEGYGFNANLYRGKKKVAFCFDDASGGEVRIDWTVGKTPKNRNDYPTEDAYEKAWAKYHQANQEEINLLKTHIDKLPLVPSSYEGIEDLKIDEGWFVSDLVTKWESEKDLRKMKRQCKTKTLFRQSDAGFGQYSIISAPCDDRIREHLRNKYGEDVEIFNDVLGRNEVPSILA